MSQASDKANIKSLDADLLKNIQQNAAGVNPNPKSGKTLPEVKPVLPDRVFIASDGSYYKAKHPKTPGCAEVNFPTPAQLRYLTEEPISEIQLGNMVHKDRTYE